MSAPLGSRFGSVGVGGVLRCGWIVVARAVPRAPFGAVLCVVRCRCVVVARAVPRAPDGAALWLVVQSPRLSRARGPMRYRARSVSRASTTILWSSTWGRPETTTVPMTPAPVTAIGNAPPWAAYVSGSRREDSSKVVPLARKREPTSSEEHPYRSTTRRLRSIQASLSGVEPGRAAWKSCWPPRRMSTATGASRSRASPTRSVPRAQASSWVKPGSVSPTLLLLQLGDELGDLRCDGRVHRDTTTDSRAERRAASRTSRAAAASWAVTGFGPPSRMAAATAA